MKNLILYLFVILLPMSLMAQDRETTNEPTGFTTVSEAARVAEQIVKASGYRVNFAIAEANVPNAVAVLRQGKRYILYNPHFMNHISRTTGTKWAAISVLAHEIGHHLYGGQNNTGIPTMATELQADEFSGYVLEKMGATLPEAQAAMSLLPQTQASLTHPGRDDRISSIAKGWKKAGGIISDEKRGLVKVPVSSESEPAIAATIYFNANPQGKYYVTKEMKVVSVRNTGTAMIGRLTRSNNTEYPYILYDDTGYSLYVHLSGAIVSSSGNIIGRVSSVIHGA